MERKRPKEENTRLMVNEYTPYFQHQMAICTRTLFDVLFPDAAEETESEDQEE